MVTKSKQVKVETTQPTIVNPDKDTIKTFFRVVVAQENAITEVFPKPIIISLRDIIELHKQIAEKLKHLVIYAAEFSANVSFENNKHQDFSCWELFETHDWHVPDVINSLTLKWHFLIKFPNEDKPAKHTVTVRLSSDLHPLHLMQTLFSKDPDEIDAFEIRSAPMSSRIDFADHTLGQELLTLISKWNEARRSPEISLPFLNKVKRYSHYIGSFIKYSVPILTFVTLVIYYWKKTSLLDLTLPASTSLIRNTVIWFAIGTAIVFTVSLVSKFLANYTQQHIGKFGRFTIFEITNGDTNKQNKLQAKNQNSLIKFVVSSTVAIILNIIAGILTALIIHE